MSHKNDINILKWIVRIIPVSALSSAHLRSLEWQRADLILASSIPLISVSFLIDLRIETGVSVMISLSAHADTIADGEFDEHNVLVVRLNIEIW